MKPPAYPIVEQKTLPPVPGRGLFSLRAPARTRSELPSIAASQARVYRSEGEFHVDQGNLRLDDPVVVRADHVSVVDMARDVEITVSMTIPSSEDVGFDVHTEFACTVVDAEMVVRDGRASASAFLRGYLNRYDRLHRLTQGLPLSEIDQVREKVQTQIKAFTDLVPPQVDGMLITYVGTDVLTPAPLSEHRATKRATQEEHEIEKDKHRVEKTRTTNQQELDTISTDHTSSIMDKLGGAVQKDPINLVMMALARGELSSAEALQRIAAERDLAVQREEQRLEAERSEGRLRDADEREELLRHRTWAREDERARMEMRFQIAKTAIENNYMDGSWTTSDIVDFVDPALRPGTDQAITEGAAAEEGNTIVVEADEVPKAAGGTSRDGAEDGVRPPVFRPTPVSEDDHDA